MSRQDRQGSAFPPQMTLGIYTRATLEADRATADKVGQRLRPRDARGRIGRRLASTALASGFGVVPGSNNTKRTQTIAGPVIDLG